MLELILNLIVLGTQALVGIYALYPPKTNKTRFRKRIAVLFVVGILAAMGNVVRQQVENRVAEVSFDDRYWWPDSQFLIPDRLMHFHLSLMVRKGSAKAMTCTFWGFTMPGPQSDEQGREAIKKFKSRIANSSEGVPLDSPEGQSCYLDEIFQFDGTQIEDLKHERSVVYMMALAKWSSKDGGEHTYPYYTYMETPQKSGFVGSLGWHFLAQ